MAGLIGNLLDDFYIRVAPEITRELTESYPSGAYLRRLIAEQSIVVLTPEASAVKRFCPGERAAISLAVEHKDWTLLLDDIRPFRVAQEMGLNPVCSPAYAAWLYERDVLDNVAVLGVLSRLAARSTVSPHLLALALRQIATIRRERR